MHVELVAATAEHLAYIAAHMRTPDVAEAWAAGHWAPLAALEMSAARTAEPLVALADGEPACAWGISQAAPLTWTGHPWLLGTPLLDAHALRILRVSKDYVESARLGYDRLVNYVDARNEKAVKWLGWLGFTLDPPAPWGVERRPFRRFWWEASNVR